MAIKPEELTLQNPQYVVYSHRFDKPLKGLQGVHVTKHLYGAIEAMSAAAHRVDGHMYSASPIGTCSLNFIHDMSNEVRMGDFIVVYRSHDGTPGSHERALNAAHSGRNKVDFSGSVVFQGTVVRTEWKQDSTFHAASYRSIFTIHLQDLTKYMMNPLFGLREIFGKRNLSYPHIFDNLLRKEYKIDVDRSVYQREDIVNKLIKLYLKNRIKDHDRSMFNKLFNPFGTGDRNRSRSSLGLQFDKAIDAFDFVNVEDFFASKDPLTTVWDYLGRLAARPMYECFVREDTGAIVFRRNCWNKVGSAAHRVADFLTGGIAGNVGLNHFDNATLLKRGSSYLHTIQQSEVTNVHIYKDLSPLKTMVAYANSTDSPTRLGDPYMARFGLKFENISIPGIDPQLTRNARTFGTVYWGLVQAGLKAAFGNIKGSADELFRAYKQTFGKKEYEPKAIQKEFIERGIANMIRGEVTINNWRPISIGDHVKIAYPYQLVEEALTLQVPSPKNNVFYVTSKTLNATVANNGQVTENLSLRLQYGALEWLDGLDSGRSVSIRQGGW